MIHMIQCQQQSKLYNIFHLYQQSFHICDKFHQIIYNKMKNNHIVQIFKVDQEELHAQQNQDFENEYLSQCLKDTRRDTITPNQNADNSLINHKQQPVNAGSSMMIYFVLRRFIKKLQFRKENMLNLNLKHLYAIGDMGSDQSQLLLYINSMQREGISIQKFTQLFNISIQASSVKKLKERFQKEIQSIKKKIGNILALVPLFHSESSYKMAWDYIAVIFRIIMLILVPIDVGYQTNFMMQGQMVLITVLLIILDFLIRINTICFIKGQAVRDRTLIFYYQIKQTFINDAVSIVMLLLYLGGQPKELQIFSFLQFKYINDLSQNSDQTSVLSKSQKGMVNLLKLIFSLMYIIHIFSCIWFWLAERDLSSSWIMAKNLNNQDWSVQYLEAFYFGLVTITTVGYGDNVPKSSQEKILIILYIIGGSLWFSYSINFIGSIIDDITENQRERNRRMRVINKYFSKRAIPYSLQYQIKEYLTYRWKEEDEIDLQLEQNLIESLSDELKESLEKQAHSLFISQSDFLNNNFSEEFRKSLFKSIKRRIVEPQNFFNIKFDDHSHLCYLEQGEISYQDKDPNKRSRINAHIRQGQFICVQDFLTDQQQLLNFKALGYVSLLTLSKQEFLKKLQEFNNDYQIYCRIRDGIVFGGINLKGGIFCPICESSEHEFQQCQQVFYQADREAIIKRHLFKDISLRKKFKRGKTKVDVHALKDKDMIEEFVIIYQTDNSYVVQQHAKLQIQGEVEKYEEPIISPKNSDKSHDCGISPGRQQQNILKTQQSQIVQVRVISIDDEETPNNKNNKLKTNLTMTPTFNQRRRSSGPYRLSLIKMQSETTQTDVVNEFNNSIRENVNQIYRYLKGEIGEDFKYNNYYQQLELLYLRLKNKDLEQFDSIKTFENYYPQYNIGDVLIMEKLAHNEWELGIFSRYIKYMYYPFNYIQQNLKHLRAKLLTSNMKSNPKFIRAKNKLKMLQLRSSFQQKKLTIVGRSIRQTQITPSSQFPSIVEI
ncbi:hypothetical protein pb186bvf_005882 [Paramecium bursaria]